MASPSVASHSKTSSRVADTDDVVMARAVQLSVWARRNAKIIIIAAVVALVLVGGYLFYRYSQAQTAERAAVAFMQVEQTAASGNATLATRDLQDFVRRFSGTTEADQARLLLARTHLEAGKPQEAVTVLQQVEEGPGEPLGARAALLLGIAQNQAGNRQAAVDTYLRVADAAELEYLREEALQQAALLRQQAGDHAGAAELFRRLVGMAEEGSFERSVYEMRLAEAEGRAG
ncbi:MAG TPA: tetratricopeptide repeat protein, partial [Longimicrobiaceae bacterium]|nr:tetratricopeptide repeat protein [Longimicrobiaceae bacterium]